MLGYRPSFPQPCPEVTCTEEIISDKCEQVMAFTGPRDLELKDFFGHLYPKVNGALSYVLLPGVYSSTDWASAVFSLCSVSHNNLHVILDFEI